MRKRNKHITVDEDIYISMVMNGSTNWSEVINNFLRSFIEMDKNKDIEENKLNDEVKEIESQIDKLKDELISKKAVLFNIIQKKDEEGHKKRDKSEKMVDSLKAAGVLGDLP